MFHLISDYSCALIFRVSFSMSIFSSKRAVTSSISSLKTARSSSMVISSATLYMSFSRFLISSFLAFSIFNWVFNRISSNLLPALNMMNSIGFSSFSIISLSIASSNLRMSLSASSSALQTFLMAFFYKNVMRFQITPIIVNTKLISASITNIIMIFLAIQACSGFVSLIAAKIMTSISRVMLMINMYYTLFGMVYMFCRVIV